MAAAKSYWFVHYEIYDNFGGGASGRSKITDIHPFVFVDKQSNEHVSAALLSFQKLTDEDIEAAKKTHLI